jgi:hypothetical protein
MKARTELVNTDTQMNEEPMTPAPQATPRTDELDEALSTISDVLVRYASMRGHSRHLERALLAAERDAARLRETVQCTIDILEQTRRERDRARELLRNAAIFEKFMPPELRQQIRAALAGKQEEGR